MENKLKHTQYKLHDLPKETLPRERLSKYGAKVLTDYELLAIILRTGTKEKSVLDLAKEVLCSFYNLGYLNDISLQELMQIKGIKSAKAIEILASIEFGKRVCLSKNYADKVNSGEDVYKLLRYDMENLTYEELRCVYLNVKGGIVDIKILTKGSFNTTQIDFREIAKWSLKLSCYNIILVHNHPSGDPSPSYHDREFTNELIKYSNNIGVTLVDHIVIGKDSFYSFNYKKIIKP